LMTDGAAPNILANSWQSALGSMLFILFKTNHLLIEILSG
jgi:hypothetical protein